MADGLTRVASVDRLHTVSAAILAGVAAQMPRWVIGEVARIVDAWGRLDAAELARSEREARAAGVTAARRVGDELEALFALDPTVMAATPLEVVRTAVREPTAVLIALGIPAVDRDEFSSRSWPDDAFGLTPAALGDLGDPDLAPLQLAWGLAKAAVLRADA